MPSALAISLSEAFSFSLTFSPPKLRKPPSLAASATLLLIVRSQVLNAADFLEPWRQEVLRPHESALPSCL